ncbi:MAG TPA: MBL fold metallo-hydrolase [Mycobacteriales bacterium]|nr:MBL fold metallo-hydrolase [Mycobacteriales bacterium]
MQVQKFGHSCLLVSEGDARVLLDPGTYSRGFEELRGLTAVLVTHQHPDHCDLDRLGPLLAANPGARVYTDEGTAAQLDDRGLDPVVAIAGEHFDAGGLAVDVLGHDHAVIHPDIPVVPNVGYLVGGRVFHPGDQLTVPDRPIEVLALPAVAPWLKIAEAIEYLRAVAPRVAIPVHDAITTVPQLYLGLLQRLGPEDTRFLVLDDGEPADV